jgi:hypothetical protein
VAKALHGVIVGMAAALTTSSPASHGDWPANRLAQDQRQFVWADREGNLTPGNLWLLNLERDVLTQLTLHEAGGYDPWRGRMRAGAAPKKALAFAASAAIAC